ncbi:MAG: extracellular solute-binding protein [Oscillospiraceae bacterium]|nr:extracellular solute-binding protein [Oscillospiraceae bacterium]
MKKNLFYKMRKFVSIFLIAVLTLSILISCGGNTANNSNNANGATDNSGGTQNPAETTTDKILPDLPDVQYDGYTFTFLTHEESVAGWDWVTSDPRELIAQIDDTTGQEVENGDPINDAVYRRNATIEDKYGINIKMVANTDEKSMLSKAVKAGDDAYDAVVMYNNNVPGIVTGDLLTETSKLTYIDRTKPWWDPAVNAMSVANKNYLLAGDLLILDREATNAIIFNKNLMASLGMDLPYSLVTQGKWTMDAMYDMTKDASADLNGDGKMTYDQDRYGFMVFNDTLEALLSAGGGSLASKDSNDIPYMSYADPQNLNVLSKAMNLMYPKSNPAVFNVQSLAAGTNNVTWEAAYYDTFSSDRALFMWIRMRVVEVFRDMTSDFGILPMPKYDETQANYCSLVNPYTGVMLGVPKSATDLDRTGVILEAMSAESKYTLQPAYYDIVLQRKYARDDESQGMLDIIFSTRTYDIGGVYSFGNVFSDFCNLANTQNIDVASYSDKNSAKQQTAIDKLVAQITALE